jgi:methylenetetrahydrofolate dehydrogenase (NADP+)/methenyltetrahydrofolate cyclohydrolase
MDTKVIDGRKIRDDMLEEIKREVSLLPLVPVFCDILVGNDKVSEQYVRIKSKAAESVGIKFHTAEFPDSISTEELLEKIDDLNRVPHMCGIIVQLPLPQHIDKEEVLNRIIPALDVDCLGKEATFNFYNNRGGLEYPTALACMKILDSINIDLLNKKIVVLGQGNLVGRPVTHLLRKQGLEVATITNQTENIGEILKNADIIISGIGKSKFLTENMIKPGVVIIDAGTSEDNGGVGGDVDLDSIRGIASLVSPTPGGVGPVTVAMLLKNVVKVAQKKLNIS